MSAEAPDGLWCRGCKKRHGYMSMGLKHEKRGDNWFQLWSCPKSYDVLGEVKLEHKVDGATETPEVEGKSGPPDEGLAP
jgi:hypothetical protein